MSSTKHAEQMDQYYERKWEGHAGYWFDHYPPSAQVYALSLMKVRNATIAAIVPNSVTKILDIGCGVGDILRELSPKTASIVGIDISSVNVRLARENLSNDGVVNATVVQGSAEELPFESNKFDVVVMADVIEHVRDIRAATQEVARVLKPGGLFLCITPHASLQHALVTLDSASRVPLRLVRRNSRKTSTKAKPAVYEHFLSPKTIVTVIRESGLSPVIYRRICFYPGPEGGGVFQALMVFLERKLGRRRFAILSHWIMNLFLQIERVELFNQKQLWVARRPQHSSMY